MINPARNVSAVNALAANVCRLPANLKRSLSDMAKTRPCVERGPRDTARVILLSRMTRFGWKHLPTVRGTTASCLLYTNFLVVDFKDETDQTAAEYYVIPVPRRVSTSRSSSEHSTPPSTMDSSLATPNLVIPAYAAGSQSGSRSNSVNSPRAPNTPIGPPRLSNVTEAFLLRHFQKYLAPWVS